MLCCHSIRGPKTSAPQEDRFVRWCVRSSRPSLWGLYRVWVHDWFHDGANRYTLFYRFFSKHGTTSFNICLQRFWPLHSTSSMPMRLPFQKASGKIDHVTRGAHVDFSRISHVLNERLQILDDNSEEKYISTTIPIANMLLRERPSSWFKMFKWKLKVSRKVDFVIKSGGKKHRQNSRTCAAAIKSAGKRVAKAGEQVQAKMRAKVGRLMLKWGWGHLVLAIHVVLFSQCYVPFMGN